MHLAGVPVVLCEHPHAILKFQQMLPLPSHLEVYFFNSSVQFSSSLVIFLLLLEGVVGLPPVLVDHSSSAESAAGFWISCRRGRISMVTLGSVLTS